MNVGEVMTKEDKDLDIQEGAVTLNLKNTTTKQESDRKISYLYKHILEPVVVIVGTVGTLDTVGVNSRGIPSKNEYSHLIDAIIVHNQ